MPVVIDGNNLMHAASRTDGREAIRRQALEKVRVEGVTITVVFDGPPSRGSPAIEHLGRVTVRYAGERSADDLIIDLIPVGKRAAEWVVVTDDRGLGRRVKERGGSIRSLAEWRRRRPREAAANPHQSKLSSREVAEWEEFFASGREDGEK
ncbi:MAG: NYN domain-containing protein [Holophagae bacterium]|jgi:hypothetical protein